MNRPGLDFSGTGLGFELIRRSGISRDRDPGRSLITNELQFILKKELVNIIFKAIQLKL